MNGMRAICAWHGLDHVGQRDRGLGREPCRPPEVPGLHRSTASSTMAGMRTREDTAFTWLLLLVTLAFAWILWPFFGAVLWAIVGAILFVPLQRRLTARMGGRRTLAAFVTLLVILLIVILPLAFLSAALVGEATGLYARMKSGEVDFARYARQVFDALPAWAVAVLDGQGLTDFAAVQERVSQGLLAASQFIAARVLTFGQGTLDFVVDFFVMLYLLFFLLRDGDELVGQIRTALPLEPRRRDALLVNTGVVIRATVKGNVVIAILQGALGGLIFWILGINSPLLWGVLMAVLSLLPAVGTALVWGPVAIYFLATGSVTQGLVLVAYGVLVIGLVDNVARPLLVGRDTKMPDYIVLISTLGGLAILGINGFVLGPVVAALFIAAWDIFIRDRGVVVSPALAPERVAGEAAAQRPPRPREDAAEAPKPHRRRGRRGPRVRPEE